jgi:hypothetical protein
MRPKVEWEVSDSILRRLKRHLQPLGIIPNREVQFLEGLGGERGERVDILLDAVAQRPGSMGFGRISATIEVKGCWNNALWTAMESQLIERYMKNNKIRHGLYLVGWFVCDQWEESSPGCTIEEARRRLEKQASDLSKGGLVVQAFVLNAALRSAKRTKGTASAPRHARGSR